MRRLTQEHAIIYLAYTPGALCAFQCITTLGKGFLARDIKKFFLSIIYQHILTDHIHYRRYKITY